MLVADQAFAAPGGQAAQHQVEDVADHRLGLDEIGVRQRALVDAGGVDGLE